MNLFVLLGQRALGLLVPVCGVRVHRIVTQGDRMYDVEASVEAACQIPGDAQGLLAGRSAAVTDSE